MLAVSTIELGLRMVLSLGFVAAVGWGLTRAARTRIGLGGGRPELRVCARQPLTRSSAVALLQAGERHFLVGVTDAGVTLLAEGDDLVPSQRPDADDDEIVDVRAGEPAPAADGAAKRVAGRRHGRTTGPVPAGMGVIEALRERTVRRR